jgi:AcrR family transcriptional regulator
MSLRQQNKAKARHSILTAAETLIAQQGVEQTTTREIAKRAGVSYQTVYNYFPTKAHILHALMSEDIQAWSQAVDAAIKQYNGDVLATLDAMNSVSLTQFQGHKLELWREITAQFFLREMTLEDQELNTLNTIAHERYYTLLHMAQGTGKLKTDVDLHLLAHTLFCLADYAIVRYVFSSETDLPTFRRNLREQTALVLRPYLQDTSNG